MHDSTNELRGARCVRETIASNGRLEVAVSAQNGRKRKGITRRRFLAAGGAVATLLRTPGAFARTTREAVDSAPSPVDLRKATTSARHSSNAVFHGSPTINRPLEAEQSQGTSAMGRMFPNLPPHDPTDQALVNLAATIPDFPPANPDNPAIPAGFTFLGQFIDHDITFDRNSLLLGMNDPNNLGSGRTARFDLDSLYGEGPDGSPELYDPNDPKKLLLVTTNGPEDVPRVSTGAAIIADPRNDQHKIILQLHIAFSKFHNSVVDHLRAQGEAEEALFLEARQIVRWHYQWVVVHDYLPRVAGQEVVNQVLRRDASGLPLIATQFFHPAFGDSFMPVEFSVAAFRFAHSMVRNGYRINALRSAVPILEGTDGLIGGSRLTAESKIVWGNFFNVPGSGVSPQPSKRIDGKISLPLGRLPGSITGDETLIRNLAERNLRRGKSFGLPSGQQVAAFMSAQVFTNAELGLTDPDLMDESPLWFYILKEAELQQRGRRLGQVGARMVVEVILGLMAADTNSYLSVAPGFQPEPPIAPAVGVFSMTNLLTFAGAA
jgi:hypothetical protein